MKTLRISEMKLKGPHDLSLCFSNGYEAKVNLTPLLYGPVLVPLREPDYFSQVKVNPESGTISWPNGADFAPEALYKMAKTLADLREELLAGWRDETQGVLFPQDFNNEEKEDLAGHPDPLRFVVQFHHATNLHYDFRLEHSKLLKSWALDHGPSLRAGQRRAAKRMEDHGMRALQPEGERLIAPGKKGAGPILTWDIGDYFLPGAVGRNATTAALQEGLEKGSLPLILVGSKLKGAFTLFREEHNNLSKWILVKEHDQFAMNEDISEQNRSVRTGRTLDQIAAGPVALF